MHGRLLRLALLLVLPLTARAELPVEDLQALPAYNVDMRQTSVSGISSGGYMAQQFHIAYSDLLIGAGVIAGGPYYCAENTVTLGLTRCMKATAADAPDPDRLAWLTREFAAQGHIADPAGLADDRVWLFSSPNDETVYQLVMDQLDQYYRRFVPDANITYVTDVPAAHSMVTDDFGYACDHVGESGNAEDHFINDCDYDAAGQLLLHLYQHLRTPRAAPTGRLIRFPQDEFLAAPRSHSMDDYGYAYVPQVCEQGARCRVHVAFHGCLQYAERIGEAFVQHAGYNEWADANRMIVLYPQAVQGLSQSNGNGCWDWWGYDDANYMWRDGRQMRAIKGMLDRLAGARSETTAPPAPSGLAARVGLNGSVELTWTQVDDPRVQGYVVYRAGVAGGPFVAGAGDVVAEPHLTLSDLTAGPHYFVVATVGQEGIESAATPALTVTVPGL